MSWFKIYNLFRQRIPENALTIDKYLPYGTTDKFPLEWDKAIKNSPSASSCLSTIEDFIEGEGFSDPELEKRIINVRGETFWQFHQQTTDSWAEFEGFYWLIKYNALGEITELYSLPFENCRLGKPDDQGYISKIYYNPFFGTQDYKSIDKKTVVFDVFTPNRDIVKTQIAEQKEKYKGQVYFFGTTTTRSRYYPEPEALSAARWMKIESGISDYHEDNLNNGFLQPFMLVMKGNPSEPSTNPDYANHNGEGQPATIAQEFDDVVAENFMGAKRVGNMFVQWVGVGEEAPTAVALPANNNGDLFITLDNQSTKKITVAWKVPAILANISEGVSLGGDGNAVRVAVKLMQQRVIKKQRVLEDNYSRVLKLMNKPYANDVDITPYNPYPELEKIDPQIWEALSAEEKRDWIEKNTDIELIDLAEAEPVEAPATQARITNAIPVSFPESVKKKVKKALEYQDKMGLKCSGSGGRKVSEAIMSNQSMPLRQLKRIHNYLKKNETLSGKPYNEGCDAVEFEAWGGIEMKNFLDVHLIDVDKWLNQTN